MQTRSFSLCQHVLERWARLKIRQAELAPHHQTAIEHLEAGVNYALGAGDETSLADAASRLRERGAGRFPEDLQSVAPLLEQRVGRLILIRELAPIASDAEIRAAVQLVRSEMATGPFSMNPRRDVQRVAIEAAGRLFNEVAGLHDETEFQAAARELLDGWMDLLRGDTRGKRLATNAVSAAVESVLEVPRARLTDEIVKYVLRFADHVPKDQRFIDGDAWVNFVRPAVGLIAVHGRNTARLEEIAELALKQLPSTRRPNEVTRNVEGVAHPGDRFNLLALLYASMLGATPRVELSEALRMFTAYIAHYADGKVRIGLRHPLQIEVALLLSDHAVAEERDAFLRAVIEMLQASELNSDTRTEVGHAFAKWLRGDSREFRAKAVERLAVHLFDNLLAELRANETARPPSDVDHSPFSAANRDSVRGALLIVALTLADLASVTRSDGEATARLAGLASIVQEAANSTSRHARGTGRNVVGVMALDQRVELSVRDQLASTIILGILDPDDEMASLALQGLRHSLRRGRCSPLSDGLMQSLIARLVERAKVAPASVKLQARLVLIEFGVQKELEARLRVLVDAAVKALNVTEGERRSIRRHSTP
jgi:hypothetical protein